jgi:hypothetical protein
LTGIRRKHRRPDLGTGRHRDPVDPRLSRSRDGDAVELDHPAYDAVYLAVAEASELRFVTADDRLTRKMREGQNRFRHMLVALSETE